jgi:hypothetical protein
MEYPMTDKWEITVRNTRDGSDSIFTRKVSEGQPVSEERAAQLIQKELVGEMLPPNLSGATPEDKSNPTLTKLKSAGYEITSVQKIDER